ncbi:DUF4397 domain-containing protein [Chitinophaga sp. 30R24]|uniref:DUF4397 domain-containing protein n=1 Tax=Chitinophaga sp. 30R24 TaxID=3248838 RepID=UPI003B9074D8
MKYLIIPIIIVVGLLGACKKNSDSAVPDTHSSFMFVNAVPNSEFNVMLDTINFASNVGYGTVTPYKSYRAQKYNVIITLSGQPVALFNVQLFLRNKRYYTAFLGADSAVQQLSLIITEDDMSSLGTGTAKFRVIDFSQGFKPNRTPLGMDVYSGAAPLFFRGLTAPSQTAFAPLYGDSAYTINFRYVDSSLVLKSFTLPTQTGKVYTLVTTGYPLDSTRFNILKVTHN